MRIATVGFAVTHKAIRKALNSCGIDHEYISLLKKIYNDQEALVQTDVESNMFEFKREPNRVTFCLVCCSTKFYIIH